MTNLEIKIGIRYMIIINLNVPDGLVNGTTGILKTITFKDSEKTIPKILWFDFESKNIGNNTRSGFIDFMKKNNISLQLTPIEAYIHTDRIENGCIHRTQFPLNPAEAITVHKS